jgi:serine/threonine-protein kinase RsbW
MSRDLFLKLELRSNPGMLCVVRGAMERLTEEFGFAAAECRSVTRAVDEALTNIMRHAYGGKGDRPIEMVCKYVSNRGGEGFEIVLTDEGSAVDPSKMRGRPLDEIKPGGLGLHFIKRAKGKNQLRLIKYLQAVKQAETGKRREDLADCG